MQRITKMELSCQELQIIELMRSMDDGQLRFIVENGVPCSAGEIHRNIFLDK